MKNSTRPLIQQIIWANFWRVVYTRRCKQHVDNIHKTYLSGSVPAHLGWSKSLYKCATIQSIRNSLHYVEQWKKRWMWPSLMFSTVLSRVRVQCAVQGHPGFVACHTVHPRHYRCVASGTVECQWVQSISIVVATSFEKKRVRLRR